MSVDIEVVGICDCIVFQTGHQLARVSEICFSKGGLQIRHYFYLRRQVRLSPICSLRRRHSLIADCSCVP